MTYLRALLVCSLALAGLTACDRNRTHPTRMEWGDAAVAPPLDCVPNLDGRIEAFELAPTLDVDVAYLFSPPGEERSVDLVGLIGSDGTQSWDLATDFASDRVVRTRAVALSERWYAASFPGGEFATPLDAESGVDGVYRHDDDGLYLLGVASREMDPPAGRTLLVYDTPILVFRLPLEPGLEWVSTGEIRDGLLRGLPYAGRDVYESRVQAAGTLRLPDLSFTQAMRVATHVTVSPAAGMAVSRRQSSFVFECFGEVARATSREGETRDDFETAAELRRLGL